MMEISDVFWEAMKSNVMLSIKRLCDEYETNPKFTVKKIFEGLELKGFCVFHDDGEFRILDECHYIGSNKYSPLKMWKFMTKDKNKLRIICQKSNTKMIEFYKRIGFNIVNENIIDYIFERVKPCQA